MRGLNKVTLTGNLGKDPQTQQLEGNQLWVYFKQYRPKKYLFEGQYTTRSVQMIFKNGLKKANINKDITADKSEKQIGSLIGIRNLKMKQKKSIN